MEFAMQCIAMLVVLGHRECQSKSHCHLPRSKSMAPCLCMHPSTPFVLSSQGQLFSGLFLSRSSPGDGLIQPDLGSIYGSLHDLLVAHPVSEVIALVFDGIKR